MKFKEFIQNNFILPRIKENGVLIVYDAEKLYHELCLELASDTRIVIDASESSIISREKALTVFNELGQSDTKLEGMIVYVPAKAPLTDDEKQKDPFALYTVYGQMFPDPRKDSDSYFELCKIFKPDYTTEITKIFNETPCPAFAVIDAVGGGSGWPNLQALLDLDSARDILFALLAPSENQKQSLTAQETWISEAKDLLEICLGLKLITRSKKWDDISDELWRYLLFSEFVFDLPGNLPSSLSNVPKAAKESRQLIEDLCDRLRNDVRTRALYIDKAESIEKDMDLPVHCKDIKDLGLRDTFPFEERCFFHQAIKTFTKDDTDEVRAIIDRRRNSVWMGKGESQAQWNLIRSALNLCEKCNDCERILADHDGNMEQLIDFYTGSLREVDRYQREFEQAITDCLDLQEIAGEVIKQARSYYRQLMDKVHAIFIRHLERTGWPLVGKLSNAEIFDKKIAPKLQQSGYRVGFFLIDALRYELGVELEKQLSDDGQIELQTALAQLPTTTPVGMAGLLPEAGSSLFFSRESNNLVPMLGEDKVSNVNQRMAVLQKRYGQRFAEMQLNQLLTSGKNSIPETVDLLVLRSTDIDSQLETSPESAFRLIYDTLKRIRVAINKLKDLGFREIVIATDHGFCLNIHPEAGDVCQKPAGNWVNMHERLLLGDGTGDNNNFVLKSEQLGIRGDFAQVAGPKGLVPYRDGILYFHGGASLQECIIPLLTMQLKKEQVDLGKPIITLSYKNGSKRITTRLPVIDIKLEAADLFASASEYELLIEAQDQKGNMIGEAKAGGPVNPATGTISLKPGNSIQIIIKMQIDFEGPFVIKAMNPTTLVEYSQVKLETDYVDGV
jgi:hypothetical protein